MSVAHTQFVIDGTTYMLESGCPQEVWPRLCDRVQKELMRTGKESAIAMDNKTGTARFKIMADHMFAAARELGVTIRWGGNWSRVNTTDKPPSSFVDMPHFEIPA